MRTLIVHATVTVEGCDQPEFVITRRFPFPDDSTLEEVADAEMRKACRQIHQPRKEMTSA